MTEFAALRARMVERQLRRRGIDDERVLTAMGEVPREAFVPPQLRHRAYADSALPIAAEQTISQPWIVAAICQALELSGTERVLEVGTGSGYSACVLSLLAAQVVSIERHQSLALQARETLASLAVTNVELTIGDGSRGQPQPALISQLAEGGRLVVPIASDRDTDLLTLLRRHGKRVETEVIGPCRFVPLIGDEGF
jgi:protein-L-isoaspartate(D-aspartate) O-methyltransferase